MAVSGSVAAPVEDRCDLAIVVIVHQPVDLGDDLGAGLADREVYTRMVVQRLAVEEEVITASEHFEDDVALPLPAQMFRFGAEEVMDNTEDFSYSLLSLNPINKKNGPGTDLEKEGLQHVVDNPGENFYGEEELGGERYFAAVYADYAVVEACVACHNNHKDSPRADLEVGDVMGGIVIRFPVD